MVTDKNTVTEIKAYLDEHGITYGAGMLKPELLALIPAEPDTTSQTSDDPVSSSADSDVQPAQPDSSSAVTQPEAPSEPAPDTPTSPSEPDVSAPTGSWENVFTPSQPEVSDEPKSTRPNNAYTVQEGDTLAKIANNYHMSVGKLKQLNGLSSNKLVVGREILIA